MGRLEMAEFTATGLEVFFHKTGGFRSSEVFLAERSAVEWDGALPVTNGAIWSERGECYCYVELKISGRIERKHTNGVWGIKGRMRFTGSEDGAAWFDVVVRERSKR